MSSIQLRPWRTLQAFAACLDAGTGAGFPAFRYLSFCPMSASPSPNPLKRKRASSTVRSNLWNYTTLKYSGDRAEQIALAQRPEIITARAVAPLDRLLRSFRKAHETRRKVDSL